MMELLFGLVAVAVLGVTHWYAYTLGQRDEARWWLRRSRENTNG